MRDASNKEKKEEKRRGSDTREKGGGWKPIERMSGVKR